MRHTKNLLFLIAGLSFAGITRAGNGKIEVGTTAKDPKDLKIIGNTSPRFRFGFNLNMNWNGFDASMFLQGVAKMDYYPHNYLFW